MHNYKSYIQKQNSWYHFRRKVPAEYQAADPRKIIKQALKTKDEGEALIRAEEANRRVMAYWTSLVESGSQHTNVRYKAAMNLATIHGFSYRPFVEVMKTSQTDFLARASKLEEVGTSEPNFQALFGTAEEPRILVSGLLAAYEPLAKQELQSKSEDQLRVWRNPRRRAVTNWIKVNGDEPIDDLTQYQALEFRDWWLDRVDTDGVRPDSGNKDINHLSKMCREICQFHRLAYLDPFSGTRLREGPEPEKHPFSREFVANRILANGALDGLNIEARAIVFIVASTGARPSEIAGLLKPAIILEHDVPHIKIAPRDDRQLKTLFSKREIPLCGSALVGAKMLNDLSTRRYSEASSSLSAVVNKYFTEHGLRETPDHSLYGLRHTFQDALEALEVTDRMQTELFGHKYNRPTYGKGPTLEHKQRIVGQIAFEF